MSYLDDEERAARVAYLIALEIATIIDDLEARQVFLIDIWGKHRDRGPFLDTIHSRYRTITLPELALLESETNRLVAAFYKELEEFRMYLSFTEDMPTSLADAYAWQLARLTAYAEVAIEALGGPPDPVEIEIPEPSDEAPRSPEDRPLLELSHFEKPPE